MYILWKFQEDRSSRLDVYTEQTTKPTNKPTNATPTHAPPIFYKFSDERTFSDDVAFKQKQKK